MPEDILKSTANPTPMLPPGQKVSFLGVILTMALAIVLILLGERIIFDLNRAANPVIEKSATVTTPIRTSGQSYLNLSSEGSALSKTRIYYPTQEKGKYLTYKMLIQAAFIVPIFLLTFLFYFMFHVKDRKAALSVVMYGYLIFAFWMLFHLLAELVVFVSGQFPNSAIYIILGVLVVVLTALVIFVQKKATSQV